MRRREAARDTDAREAERTHTWAGGAHRVRVAVRTVDIERSSAHPLHNDLTRTHRQWPDDAPAERGEAQIAAAGDPVDKVHNLSAACMAPDGPLRPRAAYRHPELVAPALQEQMHVVAAYAIIRAHDLA